MTSDNLLQKILFTRLVSNTKRITSIDRVSRFLNYFVAVYLIVVGFFGANTL
ncbi:MAG: DUF3096 domain-containing protein [Methylococcaceae bacterium]